jgi:hypothetical protein
MPPDVMLLVGELDDAGRYHAELAVPSATLVELYRLRTLGVSPGLLPGPYRGNVPRVAATTVSCPAITPTAPGPLFRTSGSPIGMHLENVIGTF